MTITASQLARRNISQLNMIPAKKRNAGKKKRKCVKKDGRKPD